MNNIFIISIDVAQDEEKVNLYWPDVKKQLQEQTNKPGATQH